MTIVSSKGPTIAQIRAARALLGISQEALAKAAGVSLMTVKRVEGAKGASESSLGMIETALGGLGIRFLRQDCGTCWVALRPVR